MKFAHTLALSLTLVLAVGCKKKEEAGSGSAAATGSGAAAGTGSGSATGSAAPTPPPAAQTGSAVGSAATGSGPAEVPAEGLVLPKTTVEAGDRRPMVEDMTMQLTVEIAPGKSMPMDMKKHAEELKEVLAANGGVATKVKVTYTDQETQTMAGKARNKPSLIDGKTYVVARVGDELEVTLEDGSAPPDEEVEKVARKERDLGKPDPMDQIIASKTWKLGEKIAFTPDELATINAGSPSADDDERLVKMELTLAGVDDGEARFDMDMALSVETPKGKMSMALTGTARVDVATGRLLEITGAGPVEGNMGAKLSGTMTIKTITR